MDTELRDAISTAKRNTECISGLTDGNKTFSESRFHWAFPVQQN